MEAHHFDEDIKVHRFCLTLLGEARLWYHSLEPLGDTTWAQLQNLFRQRYSKLDNTHEQLFHAWRSFTFHKNTETIDSYVIRIRQVANLLGYGELQILEVFKNTLPTKLYWILFPIEDLRQAVDTAKRILTKEKLNKQLTGQTSTSPFMSIREGTDKRVSFDTRDKLEDKIDKLMVVMSKLAVTDNHQRRPFKPQIYKSREQSRSYDQGRYWARSKGRNRGYGAEAIQDRTIGVIDSEEILEEIVDRIVEKVTEMKGIVTTTIEIGTDQGREPLQQTIEGIEVLAMMGLDQGPELLQIGIG